jgi:uncharacterized RDD family membrane protein YckC
VRLANGGGIRDVTCHYCRAQNSADDHRCIRCGRRLSDEPVRFPVQTGALAPELQAVVEAPEPAQPRAGLRIVTAETGSAAATAPALANREAVQPSLFGPMPVVNAQTRAPGRVTQTARRKNESAVQQRFEFTDGSRALPTSVEANVYCNAPVAPVPHRITAAAIDSAIPLLGFLVFIGAARYAAGDIAIDKSSLPLAGCAAVLIALFYRAVCCLGNMDTPGTQWAGLRLLDFDGRLPTRRMRLRRLGGGLISLMSAGLGLFWSLADEERLTWHDHISRTFPSPRENRSV